MHILIATSGALPVAPAVEFTRRLLSNGGGVTVTTVIEVPRGFLEELRSDGWHPLEDGDGGDATPSEDVLIERYVAERGKRLTEPVVSGLLAAGLDARVRFLEGADSAKQITVLADEVGADVIVVGATRHIFDQNVWESVSARIMAESLRPVLVLPAGTKDLTHERES